jgi:hypothetical protein
MNCKRIILIVIFLSLASVVHPTQKWKTVVAGWRNLSMDASSAVPAMIRRSIALQLSQLSIFEVSLAPDWTPEIRNWADPGFCGRTIPTS